MSDVEYEREGYLSYGGMARSPMVWGIPFMGMLSVGAGSLLLGFIAGSFFGLPGWLLALMGVPILIFIKQISVTDDKAVDILMIEAKWFLLRRFTGNTKYYGGAMMISSVSYGRKVRDVKQYLKTAARG